MKRQLGSWAIAGLLVASLVAQTTSKGVEEAIRVARTKPIAPKAKPPKWMDYEKVEAGYAFLRKHQKTAVQVMGTSSLAATFAARDVAPVLMQTGRLPRDFDQRMKETGDLMGAIFDSPTSRDGFVKDEYAKAVSLGELHAAVASGVQGLLRWDPKTRRPMNGQAYAFVLYTFAWMPVEAMMASKELDPVAEAKGLEGWFHLMSVLGYAMGTPEELLPRDYARAGEISPALRQAQYAASGEPLLEGIPTLLGGQVRMVEADLARQMKLKPQQTRLFAAGALAGFIAKSPGLSDALGLGPDPAAKLKEYAALPPSK